MAGPTWAQARANDTASGNLLIDTVDARSKDLIAVLASGQNPDGSAFALPVSVTSTVPDVSASGTISANTAVTLVLSGQASVTIQDVNTGFTGTVNFEGSDDGGTTWFSLAVWPVGTTASGNLITSAATVTETANHLWEGNVAALSHVRVRGSGVSAGSAAVVIRAGLSTSSVVLDGPLPAGTAVIGHVIADTGSTTAVTGNVTVVQPTGTNLHVDVDTALPAGTNVIGHVIHDTGSTTAVTGNVSVTPAASVYPNGPTNVVAANADTSLTASNGSRTGLIVSNDSTAKLYVLVDKGGAAAASATNFTYVVGAGGTLELPVPGGSVPTARIRGFWSVAQGTCSVTDIS